MAETIIQKDKCKGCRLCIFFCPSKTLELSPVLNKKGVKYPKRKDGTVCTGCGFCYLVCPDACFEILDTHRVKGKEHSEKY